MVGSIVQTSPAPGMNDRPGSGKDETEHQHIAKQAPRSQVGLPKTDVYEGTDNEPPEEFSGIKERRQRTLQVVPPQA